VPLIEAPLDQLLATQPADGAVELPVADAPTSSLGDPGGQLGTTQRLGSGELEQEVAVPTVAAELF
jgi:hypothetical protein